MQPEVKSGCTKEEDRSDARTPPGFLGRLLVIGCRNTTLIADWLKRLSVNYCARSSYRESSPLERGGMLTSEVIDWWRAAGRLAWDVKRDKGKP